jgi:hypothetical protein
VITHIGTFSLDSLVVVSRKMKVNADTQAAASKFVTSWAISVIINSRVDGD